MATVNVGCKLPNGLIIEHDGQKVRLNGTNSSMVIGGFGITHGVDEEFFNAWMAKAQEFPPVAKGLIWAHSRSDSAAAKAKEMASEKNGFEGLDQKDPVGDINARIKEVEQGS